MERLQATLAQLDLGHGVQTAISRRRSESGKVLLGMLLGLAEARQTTMSEHGLRMYLTELREFDIQDVQQAVRQLAREIKGEYEPAFPQLGTVIARTKEAAAARLRPKPWVRCGQCSEAGMVVRYYDKDDKVCGPEGHYVRTAFAQCECRQRWRAERDAARANLQECA